MQPSYNVSVQSVHTLEKIYNKYTYIKYIRIFAFGLFVNLLYIHLFLFTFLLHLIFLGGFVYRGIKYTTNRPKLS